MSNTTTDTRRRQTWGVTFRSSPDDIVILLSDGIYCYWVKDSDRIDRVKVPYLSPVLNADNVWLRSLFGTMDLQSGVRFLQALHGGMSPPWGSF